MKKINIGFQPLTTDYNISKSIGNTNFENICDTINKLQEEINDIDKRITQKSILNSHTHVHGVTQNVVPAGGNAGKTTWQDTILTYDPALGIKTTNNSYYGLGGPGHGRIVFVKHV